jgi:hypothetical protein
MDTRRHERGPEATLHDFALVTTYLPIIGLTLRAAILVSCMYWCMYTVHIPFSGVIVLSASVVYVDALLLNSQLDRAAGHLCLVALAVATQQHGRECSDVGTVLTWVCDLLWSACTSAEVISSVSALRNNVPTTVKVLAGCAFACAHVLLACSQMNALEMLVRAVLFYVLCSLVVLCGPFAPPPDRCSCSVLHLSAPVLFVHAYPALASVLLLVGAHARLVYFSFRGDGKRHANAAAVPAPGESESKQQQRAVKHSEYSELSAKLLAAKRAHGLV